MRIGIDCHTIGSRAGGNESYTQNLVRALARIDSRNEYRLYVTHRGADIESLAAAPNFTLVHIAPRHPAIRIPVSLPFELARHPVDVLHIQYISPPFGRTPVVNMVHDLSHFHFPEWFNRREVWRQRMFLPRAVRHAAHVLTVSQYCKDDIARTFGLPEQRITLTYPGVSDAFRPMPADDIARVLARHSIQPPYFLYVGNIQPRKNVPGLLEAFAILKRERQLPHRLVIAGRAAWLYADVFRRVRELGIESDVIFTSYVAAADLPALYSGASVFVFASFFEGFGSPPLEAMACGVPVVASKRPAFPEVLGDAALLIDPTEPREIARAIERIVHDAQLRAQLIARGGERAARYRWEDTARQTLAVFAAVA